MLLAALVLLGLVLLGLVVLAGTRMVQHPDGSGGSIAQAMGPVMAIFDPGRARAERELESRRLQGGVAPTPQDDDRLVRVDLSRGTARIRPR